ncbi:MAG: mandelate racemase/muconate lactonizing enzyme family protein [Phycisphaeraceae bacterium]|nr:mandelate racemase/muconate lactonizing enzyme family protein [Phycisphaeraceae bacterium]
MSNIAHIEAIPVQAPAKEDDLDGSVDTLVVRITDEDGRCGIGECDAPPEVVKAFIDMPTAHLWSRNIAELLVGRDPLELTGLWETMYEATSYPGRRGLGIHAISAIDIALHDLAGRQIGKPAYKLMGGARRPFLTPYATIFPGMPRGRSITEILDVTEQQFQKAMNIGFHAVKMEVLYEDLVTDAQLVDCIRQGRRMLGDAMTMMVDFGYRWHSWHDAKWVLDRIEDCNIYFAEAAIQHDDLHGHSRLSRQTSIRVCGAEHAATRWEIREWIETGKVAVVQPDINRCGGLTEIRRISDMANLYGVLVIPHGWKTGITAACGRHFQASTINAPWFEFLSPDLYDSPLRRELVSPEPTITNGRMALPDAPGLGVELNDAALAKFRRD